MSLVTTRLAGVDFPITHYPELYPLNRGEIFVYRAHGINLEDMKRPETYLDINSQWGLAGRSPEQRLSEAQILYRQGGAKALATHQLFEGALSLALSEDPVQITGPLSAENRAPRGSYGQTVLGNSGLSSRIRLFSVQRIDPKTLPLVCCDMFLRDDTFRSPYFEIGALTSLSELPVQWYLPVMKKDENGPRLDRLYRVIKSEQLGNALRNWEHSIHSQKGVVYEFGDALDVETDGPWETVNSDLGNISGMGVLAYASESDWLNRRVLDLSDAAVRLSTDLYSYALKPDFSLEVVHASLTHFMKNWQSSQKTAGESTPSADSLQHTRDVTTRRLNDALARLTQSARPSDETARIAQTLSEVLVS